MMEENQIQPVIKGSNTPYLGIGILGSLIGTVGWMVEWEVMYLIGGTVICLGAGMQLLARFKKVSISEEGIEIRRGQLGFKQQMNFADIGAVYLQEERGKNGLFLMEKPLNTIHDWKKIRYLEIEVKGKKKYIPASDFEDEAFKELARSVQHHLIETNGSSSQKLGKVRLKTIRYLENDRKLCSDLRTSVYEACKSIYKSNETLYTKQQVEAFEQDKSIVYHSIKQGNVLIYFQKHQFLPEIKRENVEMAADLVVTAKENLEVVNSRIASHEELLKKLDKLAIQVRSREKLQEVAEKIGSLQERNLKSQTRPDIKLEAEVIEQFELLTENINHTQTLEKSILLKENLNAFREMEEGEERLLKELNKKLEE
ncbi:MAG: hypothetical protein ACI85I_000825 [Arenicella sp.]|jgi:hypothetical protein